MRKNWTFLFGELNPFMDVRPTKTPKPQSQPDWPPDAPADSSGREGWKEGGKGSISPLCRGGKRSRHRRSYTAAPRNVRAHLKEPERLAGARMGRRGGRPRAEPCRVAVRRGEVRGTRGGSDSFLLKLPGSCSHCKSRAGCTLPTRSTDT